jgi:hypothetical protein
MPQPVSYNPGTPVSGSIQENNISYVVDGQQRNYRGGFGGLSWMSEVPAENNVIFIGNSTSLGRGPANIPLFYPAYNNSSANIVYAANTLPGSPRNFTTTGSAYNWAVTNNFFINNSDNPIPRIDADGLALYLDANQPSSYPQINNTWYDLSGQNNVTNLLNGPAWNSNGWIVFDSTDDYADTSINTNALFSSNDPFSVLITIKPTETINANSGLVTNQKYQSEVSPGGFGLVTYNANQVAINLTKNDGTGTVSYEALAPTTLTINSWQNITYTYDPVAGTVTGYKNGTLANSSTSAAYKWTPEARVSWIGRNWQGGWSNDFFSSEISNVSIYRKTLSQSEIKQNYFQSNIVQDGLIFMVDANNLVSYPKSGTTSYSLTGSNTATLVNGVGYSSQNGGSFVFDGVDDYIQTNLNQNTDNALITWECWYFDDSPGGYVSNTALISNYGPSGTTPFTTLHVTTAGNVSFGQRNSVGAEASAFYSGNICDGRWHHVVGTVDSSNISIYIDGALQASNAKITGVTTSGQNIVIGSNHLDRYQSCRIANARLYNVALTPAQIQQNYQATKDKFQGQQIVTNGLVLNLDSANKDSYPGTGTTWTDLSGNGYNNTLNNGVAFMSNVNGGVLSFDGTDDFGIGSISSTIFSGAHSIGCWFYRRSVTEWAGLFSNNVGTASCSILTFISTTNSIGTNQAGVNGTSIAIDLGADHLNKWIYCVIVYTGATNGSQVNVYAYEDGNLLTATGNLYWNLSTHNQYYVSRHWTGATQILNGNIPVVQVYNRALSATEIAQNYNAQKTRFGL